MSRFDFDKAIPLEVLPAIRGGLEPLEWLLPPWCQTCTVAWCDAPNDAVMELHCQYSYRRVYLTVYPSFLTYIHMLGRTMCIHELLHCSTGIMADYARDEINRLLPEPDAPKYRSCVLDELTARHESMTQDLAWMINQKLLELEAQVMTG